jgi:hypothetical protein
LTRRIKAQVTNSNAQTEPESLPSGWAEALDLNKLARQGWVRPRAKLAPHFIQWSYSYTGEQTTRGLIIVPELAADDQEPCDLVFINADKPSTPDYFRWALKLSRCGSLTSICREAAAITMQPA